MAARQGVDQLRGVGDAVGVAPPDRGEAGVEPARRLDHPAYAQVGRENARQAMPQGLERWLRRAPHRALHHTGLDVEVGHLPARVHTRVRAPGHGHPGRRHAEGGRESLLEGPLHRAQARLGCPAGEVGAVIGTVDPQAHATILGRPARQPETPACHECLHCLRWPCHENPSGAQPADVSSEGGTLHPRPAPGVHPSAGCRAGGGGTRRSRRRTFHALVRRARCRGGHRRRRARRRVRRLSHCGQQQPDRLPDGAALRPPALPVRQEPPAGADPLACDGLLLPFAHQALARACRQATSGCRSETSSFTGRKRFTVRRGAGYYVTVASVLRPRHRRVRGGHVADRRGPPRLLTATACRRPIPTELYSIIWLTTPSRPAYGLFNQSVEEGAAG